MGVLPFFLATSLWVGYLGYVCGGAGGEGGGVLNLGSLSYPSGDKAPTEISVLSFYSY